MDHRSGGPYVHGHFDVRGASANSFTSETDLLPGFYFGGFTGFLIVDPPTLFHNVSLGNGKRFILNVQCWIWFFFTGFFLGGFTQFFWIRPTASGLDRVLLGFTGFYEGLT